MLLAAFLVFGMQVGFTMLEAGFCRSRETVNVLMECIVDTCLCGVLFYAWGFAFMFGHGNGFIGWGGLARWQDDHDWFFLQNAPATYEGYRHRVSGVLAVPVRVRRLCFDDLLRCHDRPHQLLGRLDLQRLRFRFHLSDRRPLGLGSGWLPLHDGRCDQTNFLPSLGTGFHDFAGSTVVHTIGGAIALAGAIVLGPRLGRKFKRDGGGPMMPHDLTIAAIGGLILWFGWYGFNPGSTLSIMDMAGAGRVAANTTLAACSAGLLACFWGYAKSGKWDVSYTVNGFLAGLVAITCPCYWVTPAGSLALGAVAGVLVILGDGCLGVSADR